MRKLPCPEDQPRAVARRGASPTAGHPAVSARGDTRDPVCSRCGALNAPDFDRCIRCAAPLTPAGRAVERFSAPLDARSAPATKAFAALTILVFAAQLLAALSTGRGVKLLGGAGTELRFGAMPVVPELVLAEPWRLLSAVFVHFGVLHVAMNTMALLDLGRVAELAVGTARFAIGFVVTGACGFATTVAVSALLGGPQALTAGASGAVFGIMGLVLGVLVRRRDPQWKSFAVRGIVFSIVIVFAMSSAAGVLVNNSAHFGGLAVGFLLGLAFAYTRRAPRDTLANVLAAACLAACVGALGLAQLSSLPVRF